jgi:hypothetical protein
MTQKTPTLKTSPAKGKGTSGKSGATALAKKHQEAQDHFPDDRHRMIAEAAYLVAEQRNFSGDLALDDWLQAEAEIDALFVEKH